MTPEDREPLRAILAGLVAHGMLGAEGDYAILAERAVKLADAILTELGKPK